MARQFTLRVATDTVRGHQKSTVAFVSTRPPELDPATALLILAEGTVGSGARPDILSQLTIDTISQELRDLFAQPSPNLIYAEGHLRNRLQQAASRAHLAICTAKQTPGVPIRDGDFSSMTCAFVYDGLAIVTNVGINRTYHFRNGRLRQITEDHSRDSTLRRKSQARETYRGSEAHADVERYIVVRALGHNEGSQVDTFAESIEAGDQLLICNVGVWKNVPDIQLAQCLYETNQPETAAHRLVTLTRDDHSDLSVIVASALART